MINLLYLGTFGGHCSDSYRVTGLHQSGLFNIVDVIDFRVLKPIAGNDFSRRIVKVVQDTNTDVILMNKVELITPFDIKYLKNACPNLVIAYWYGDVRDELEEFVIEKLPLVDVFMTNNQDDEYWKMLKNYNVQQINFSHTATDIDVFKKYKNVTEKYDIIFFGGQYGNKFKDSLIRTKFIKQLASEVKYKIKICGKGWSELKSFDNVDVGGVVYGDDYSRMASQAKIILGFNSYLDIFKYTSNRTWNSMACGFYLTHKFAGIETFFTKNVHLDWFSNYKEMKNLIDFYLNNPQVRYKIHSWGRSLIHENHTYKVRADEMYGVFKNLIDKKSC